MEILQSCTKPLKCEWGTWWQPLLGYYRATLSHSPGIDIKHLVYLPIGHVLLKIYLPRKIFHMLSQYLYKPSKADVYWWKNKYMPRLKNVLSNRTGNHKILFALGQHLQAPIILACLIGKSSGKIFRIPNASMSSRSQFVSDGRCPPWRWTHTTTPIITRWSSQQGSCSGHSTPQSFPCKFSFIRSGNLFVYAPSQWEMTLQCNTAFQWLSAFTKWSLSDLWFCSSNLAIIFVKSKAAFIMNLDMNKRHVTWFFGTFLLLGGEELRLEDPYTCTCMHQKLGRHCSR